MDQNSPFPAHMVNSLQRRGLSPQLLLNQSPMQTQVTPESANFDPSLQTPTATPTPDHPAQMGGLPTSPGSTPNNPVNGFMNSIMPQSAQPTDPGQAAMAGQTNTLNPLQTEAETIIKALTDRLSHHSKQASKFLASILPAPAPAQPK